MLQMHSRSKEVENICPAYSAEWNTKLVDAIIYLVSMLNRNETYMHNCWMEYKDAMFALSRTRNY